MIKSFIPLILVLIVIPGCYKINIDREFLNVKNLSKNMVNSEINFEVTVEEKKEHRKTIKEKISLGISRDDAISIALKNNNELQANFENLGIAKSDLIQAGLYTNPRIDSVFRFPKDEFGGQTNIEIVGSVHLSDLWQVPLKKNISEDILEIVTQEILKLLLDTMSKARMSYDKCLYLNQALKTAEKYLHKMQELREQIYYRQGFGFTREVDKYKTDLMVDELKLDIIDYKSMLNAAFIELKEVMGINPTKKRINLTEKFYNKIFLPNLNLLENYALKCRPEIQIATLKIKQYEDLVKLEKANTWRDVDVGVSFKQDFERPFRGAGPFIGVDLPIFDSNFAQVNRVHFLLRKAEKEFEATQLKIKKEVRKPYSLLIGLKEKVHLYQKSILTLHKKSISWTCKYAKSMQLNWLEPLEAQLDLYKSIKKMIEVYHDFWDTFTELERSVGKKILNENF